MEIRRSAEQLVEPRGKACIISYDQPMQIILMTAHEKLDFVIGFDKAMKEAPDVVIVCLPSAGQTKQRRTDLMLWLRDQIRLDKISRQIVEYKSCGGVFAVFFT